ncbi:hypothetical protein L914_12238 [Phytophthora nicotianae]|uniref:Uncharacterized protein n=1 Tax=Phytophthora nicotianae TaxID=4792 RepID=W2N0A1_PHYNI|nr:hypothetical protein L914_12238 [Phytophthora nicotianae]
MSSASSDVLDVLDAAKPTDTRNPSASPPKYSNVLSYPPLKLSFTDAIVVQGQHVTIQQYVGATEQQQSKKLEFQVDLEEFCAWC